MLGTDTYQLYELTVATETKSLHPPLPPTELYADYATNARSSVMEIQIPCFVMYPSLLLVH